MGTQSPPLFPAEHYAELIGRSRRVCAESSAILTRSREARAWSALFAGVRTIPPPLVVICAYCGSIRTPKDSWLPPSVTTKYHLSRLGALLSHGCCPGCLDRYTQSCSTQAG